MSKAPRTWTFPELVVKLAFLTLVAAAAYYGYYLFFSIIFGGYGT